MSERMLTAELVVSSGGGGGDYSFLSHFFLDYFALCKDDSIPNSLCSCGGYKGGVGL